MSATAPTAESTTLRAALVHLQAGQWQAAHTLVQPLESPTAAWLHGIVHILEGDESNARYWYTLARRPFPGMAAVPAELVAASADLGLHQND